MFKSKKIPVFKLLSFSLICPTIFISTSCSKTNISKSYDSIIANFEIEKNIAIYNKKL